MKNILVTGGAGYIGSHTCVALVKAGFQPFILDNFANSEKWMVQNIEKITGATIPCFEGDVRNAEYVEELLTHNKIEGIIHFAALKAVGESVRQPLAYYDNNVNGLVQVLKAMQAAGCFHLVFSSSCTVYGEPDQLPVTEKSPLKPAQSPYGATKQMGEQIIQDFHSSSAPLKAFILRYFNPIGAHESALIGELPRGVPNNLVPFITQTAIGKREKLMVFGHDYPTRDGTCIRDYIDIMDLAEAHVKALEQLQSVDESKIEICNVGTGKGVSVQEVIDTFEEVTGNKLNYEYTDRRPGDVIQIYADASYAETVLKWKARRSLADSLESAWKWEEGL
jgi:UDP-glucose 4-epimerase